MSERSDANEPEALRWLAQADEDILAARRIASGAGLPPRITCFLCHLAAEKALKAWLISIDRSFPKVHDLRALLALLPESATVLLAPDDLDTLNPWVIEGRYPGDISDATRADAEECIEAAGRVVRTTGSALGRDDR